MTPEAKARIGIDALLVAAGWHVCDMAQAHIHAARGVAIREFPLNTGFGFADYLLYIDGKAAGVIEAKKEGATLTGVEAQSARYAQGLPASLADSDNLPPPDVIAQEIVDDLEAALEQFRLIAGDLVSEPEM